MKYDSDAVCERCGETYGNHSWIDDHCPTKEQIEKNKSGGTKWNDFNKHRKFKLKEASK